MRTEAIRVCRRWCFGGVASTAMIDDEKAIFDYSPFVDEDTVMEAMDAPELFPGVDDFHYFHLVRKE